MLLAYNTSNTDAYLPCGIEIRENCLKHPPLNPLPSPTVGALSQEGESNYPHKMRKSQNVLKDRNEGVIEMDHAVRSKVTCCPGGQDVSGQSPDLLRAAYGLPASGKSIAAQRLL